jgi:hypothetical protein
VGACIAIGAVSLVAPTGGALGVRAVVQACLCNMYVEVGLCSRSTSIGQGVGAARWPGFAEVAGGFQEAMALSGEAAIGIYAARGDEPGDFDVMEYVATNCASVGEALQHAARFIALMHDGSPWISTWSRRWRRCACGRRGPRA